MSVRFLKSVLLFFGVMASIAIASSWYFFVYDHLYEVVPGQVWRSAQLDVREFESLSRQVKLRSVINLRGAQHDSDWYQEQRALTKLLGITQVDLKLSAYKLPRYDLLHKLIHYVDNAERPALIHCFFGIDRSGLASVVVLLLDGHSELKAIHHEVSILKGVVRKESAGRQFLAQYVKWLDAAAMVHTSDKFRRWALRYYKDDKANLYWSLDAINGEYRPVTDGVLPKIHDSKLRLRGWTVDLFARQPLEMMDIVWGDTVLGQVAYGKERDGVAKFFNNTDYLYSGWAFSGDVPKGECAPVKFGMYRNNGEYELSKDQLILCNEKN